MKLGDAVMIVSRLQEQGVDAKVNSHYSGRGMYGKETVAVETEATQMQFGFAVALIDGDDRFQLTSARYDNLGDGWIYY